MTTESRWLIASAAGVVVTIALIWWTSIPLGIPGEWTWNRIPVQGLSAQIVLGVIQASIAAAAYIGAVWFIGGRIDGAGNRAVVACLAFLVAAAFAWLWTVQECPPGAHAMQKTPLVLYSPAASGYFFHARFHIDDTAAFLRDYESWVSQGDVLHFGTHPPGLFLFHHALNRLCDSSPRLTSWLLSTQPESVRDSLDLIAQFPMGAPRPLEDAGRASLWLAALITQLVASLTVIPLYLVLRRSCSRSVSWITAALWPLVPSVAIFLPKSDALYPFVGMVLLQVWMTALERRSSAWGAVAGILLVCGLCLSLALLPVALLAVILMGGPAGSRSAVETSTSRATRRDLIDRMRRRTAPAVGLTLAVVLMLAGLWIAWDINLLAVWVQNFRNHAGFYGKFHRTIWLWMLVNPVELATALGWPVTVLAVGSLARQRRSVAEYDRWNSLAIIAVWGLLWVSGKNSGEVARLWIVIMPWFVWLAGMQIKALRTSDRDAPNADPTRVELSVLFAQSIACIVTVLRVTGFHFGA